MSEPGWLGPVIPTSSPQTQNPMKPSRHPFFGTFAVIAAFGVVSSAHAATHTWTGTTAGTYNWTSPTNWTVGHRPVVSTPSSATPAFLAASTAIISNNDNATVPFKLNQLSFTNVGPSSGTAPTVTLTGSQLEFISNGATTPTMTFNTTGSVKPTIDIQNNLLLTNNLGIAATTDGKLSGAISGGGTLTKSGAGTLTLSNSNTYSDQPL